MDKELIITVDSADVSAYRFILEGRISTSTANTLEFKLNEAMRDGHTNLILNMCQVSFLSSAGIRILLMFFKRAKANGGSFFVENPSENVINVLGMVALDEMLLK
ncbi:MAG: STAS domain-containing protein [Oscillospiraceae bacterium]|nr:STAS domain-containing protein [Oscillospiraceae bacterium]